MPSQILKTSALIRLLLPMSLGLAACTDAGGGKDSAAPVIPGQDSATDTLPTDSDPVTNDSDPATDSDPVTDSDPLTFGPEVEVTC